MNHIVKVVFKDGNIRYETFSSQEHLEAFISYIKRALEGCISEIMLVQDQDEKKKALDKIKA